MPADWTRLRALRKAARLNQSSLGASQRAVSMLETGDRNDPRISTVLKIAAGLGMPLGSLLAAIGYSNGALPNNKRPGRKPTK